MWVSRGTWESCQGEREEILVGEGGWEGWQAEDTDHGSLMLVFACGKRDWGIGKIHTNCEGFWACFCDQHVALFFCFESILAVHISNKIVSKSHSSRVCMYMYILL